MSRTKATYALLKGLELCVQNPECRRLAIKPWIIGAICYIVTMAGAFFFHTRLVAYLAGDGTGTWAALWYWTVWVSVAAMLLALTLVVSFALVMVFAGVFQTALAAAVLRTQGLTLPPDASGFVGGMKEIGRTVIVESTKLLWLVPMLIICLFCSLIPILTPIGLVMSAWLLGYQFMDTVLDIFKIGTLRRLGLCIRYSVSVILFGGTLLFLWPVAGLFLSPIAVAAAAWLVATSSLRAALPTLSPSPNDLKPRT